jgi:hypothetical protein
VADLLADQELGKVISCGIYDVGRNHGWVSVGIDHDTAEFAVDSILAWWRCMGSKIYPAAKQLLIMADAGGTIPARFPSRLTADFNTRLGFGFGQFRHILIQTVNTPTNGFTGPWDASGAATAFSTVASLCLISVRI